MSETVKRKEEESEKLSPKRKYLDETDVPVPLNNNDKEDEECPVCREKMQLETTFPCQHKFCFNCAKSMAFTGSKSRCGLCRRDIPQEFFYRPDRYVCKESVTSSRNRGEGGSYCWYYATKREGIWWQYDDASSARIEEEYQRDPNSSSVQLIFAGHTYEIDLASMTQARKNPGSGPIVVRKIKRDLRGSDRVGIAGILDEPCSSSSDEEYQVSSSDDVIEE